MELNVVKSADSEAKNILFDVCEQNNSNLPDRDPFCHISSNQGMETLYVTKRLGLAGNYSSTLAQVILLLYCKQ